MQNVMVVLCVCVQVVLAAAVVAVEEVEEVGVVEEACIVSSLDVVLLNHCGSRQPSSLFEPRYILCVVVQGQ